MVAKDERWLKYVIFSFASVIASVKMKPPSGTRGGKEGPSALFLSSSSPRPPRSVLCSDLLFLPNPGQLHKRRIFNSILQQIFRRAEMSAILDLSRTKNPASPFPSSPPPTFHHLLLLFLPVNNYRFATNRPNLITLNGKLIRKTWYLENSGWMALKRLITTHTSTLPSHHHQWFVGGRKRALAASQVPRDVLYKRSRTIELRGNIRINCQYLQRNVCNGW